VYARQPGFTYDLSYLTTDRQALEISAWDLRRESALDLVSSRTLLDRTQSLAFLDALSRELSLVQGPPLAFHLTNRNHLICGPGMQNGCRPAESHQFSVLRSVDILLLSAAWNRRAWNRRESRDIYIYLDNTSGVRHGRGGEGKGEGSSKSRLHNQCLEVRRVEESKSWEDMFREELEEF
jgi:hypothetical protein